MRLRVWCVWTSWMLSVHGAAEQRPVPAERAPKPAAEPRGPGGQIGERRATVDGPVCGLFCCHMTRRCPKVRCPQRCRSNTSCQHFSKCFLVPSFSPSEPGPLTSTRPIHNHRSMATARPSRTTVLSPEEEPQSEFRPERDPSSSEELSQMANHTTPEFHHLTWTGSSEEIQQEAPRSQRPHLKTSQNPDHEEYKTRLGPNHTSVQVSTVQNMDSDSRATSKSRSGSHPVTADRKNRPLSLREAQALLMRKTLVRGGRGAKMATALMNHIEKERKKLSVASSSSLIPRSTRRKGEYGVHLPSPAVQCPLLCKNGGSCLRPDHCSCPPNFTGKFCQIPVTPTALAPSSSNNIIGPEQLSATATNWVYSHSQFQEVTSAGAPSPTMVKVTVHHPPEANVKIHHVQKVPDSSPALQALESSMSSGSAGAPAPAVGWPQILGGGRNTNQQFKYCFSEVKNGRCSSRLRGLRSKENCCRGFGKAWGDNDQCVLCPQNKGQNNSCPAGFERTNETHCVDVNECLQPGLCVDGLCVNTRGSYSCVCREGFLLDATHGICVSQLAISEERGHCYWVPSSGLGPSSCSGPFYRNVTKHVCCCTRVGKFWGANCMRCPYMGSGEAPWKPALAGCFLSWMFHHRPLTSITAKRWRWSRRRSCPKWRSSSTSGSCS
ncbi:latent-transforming growth factor beta-binding protein 1-like isoform X2 [Takifugu rubripes]|uniref:latent-transforming growth factor beta-binding protein 1-like isoform X2 n=1 Tax=Takifugu rubripes TaxID=31033 RepID=UPI001145689B|nr:latent-transforming growth factor beta-binding protein 1-like isoform X2 [Takifugu rubripes]